MKENKHDNDKFYTPAEAVYPIIPYLNEWLNTGDKIWECCSGEGHIEKVLQQSGFGVLATDIDQGYDALTMDIPEECQAIITNPPFSEV